MPTSAINNTVARNGRVLTLLKILLPSQPQTIRDLKQSPRLSPGESVRYMSRNEFD